MFIDIDDKPRHPGFDRMADLARSRGFTSMSAGWWNSPIGPCGEAQCFNRHTNEWLQTVGSDPIEAIEKMQALLAERKVEVEPRATPTLNAPLGPS